MHEIALSTELPIQFPRPLSTPAAAGTTTSATPTWWPPRHPVAPTSTWQRLRPVFPRKWLPWGRFVRVRTPAKIW